MSRNRHVPGAIRAELRGVLVEGAKVFMRAAHGATVRQTTSGPGTPVLTGEARSGNRVGLDTPPAHIPPDDAPFYGIAGSDHVDAALAGMKAGDVMYHRNRVPYAPVLEGGRRFSPTLNRMVGSVQAPDGFYRQAFEHGIRAVERWRGQ